MCVWLGVGMEVERVWGTGVYSGRDVNAARVVVRAMALWWALVVGTWVWPKHGQYQGFLNDIFKAVDMPL